MFQYLNERVLGQGPRPIFLDKFFYNVQKTDKNVRKKKIGEREERGQDVSSPSRGTSLRNLFRERKRIRESTLNSG